MQLTLHPARQACVHGWSTSKRWVLGGPCVCVWQAAQLSDAELCACVLLLPCLHVQASAIDHACALQEEAEWHALLQKVELLDQQQLALAPGGAVEAAAAADGAAAVAPPAGGSSSPAAAEQQRPSGGSSDGEESELVALAQLHAGVHRHLAMQVEGVCKLVGDVEEMVERANRSAAAVQVRCRRRGGVGWCKAAVRMQVKHAGSQLACCCLR